MSDKVVVLFIIAPMFIVAILLIIRQLHYGWLMENAFRASFKLKRVSLFRFMKLYFLGRSIAIETTEYADRYLVDMRTASKVVIERIREREK